MEKGYIRIYRGGGGSGSNSSGGGEGRGGGGGIQTGRHFRYSGAHTTALDTGSTPTKPKMSYTARKYSSSLYSPSCSPRRCDSRENIVGRPSSDRVSCERYNSRGCSTDRFSSGYSSYSPSSRRGSTSSDILSTSTSLSNYSASSGNTTAVPISARSSYSYNSLPYHNGVSSGSYSSTNNNSGSSGLSRYHSNTDLDAIHETRFSAERNGNTSSCSTASSTGRYSRHNSGELSTSSSTTSAPEKYSGTNSSDLASSSMSSVASSRAFSQQDSNSNDPYSSSVTGAGLYSMPVNNSTDTSSSIIASSTVNRYSRQNGTEIGSKSAPSASAFVSGYASLERRNTRRKKEFLMDRSSADRLLSLKPLSYSSTSLDRKKKYTRTYSCDLPGCQSPDLPSRCERWTSNSPSPRVVRSGASSLSLKNEKERGRDIDRERSPTVRAIYDGLARINEALQKHKDGATTPQHRRSPSVCSRLTPSRSGCNTPDRNGRHTPDRNYSLTRCSSDTCGRNTPSTYRRSKTSFSPSAIRTALTSNVRSPRARVNSFFRAKEANVEKQVNVVPDIVIPAEARLAQRRAARAEARELRLRELEKQQQDQENEEEKQFGTPTLAEAGGGDDDEEDEEDEEEEPSPRSMGGTRTSVGRTSALNSTGQYSRRSSEDSTTEDSALPANIREMRAELKELDEKFRKAMITNAQLDNEKSTLTFEVELLKDQYTELEEAHTQLTKEHRKKCTEYEQLKKVSTKLQEEVRSLRALLQERDQLIQEYGLIVVGEEENGADVDADDLDNDVDILLSPRKIAVKKALVSQEAAELLSKGSAEGSLDIRLKKFGEEKNDLEDQVRRLKLELEEERNKNRRKENGLDYEKQKEQSKTVNEYKFRVQKAEAEVLTLQANVARLDALSTRYKTQSEELEKSEEELKVERRKLQRELRDLRQNHDEMEAAKNYLQRQYDKMKHEKMVRH